MNLKTWPPHLSPASKEQCHTNCAGTSRLPYLQPEARPVTRHRSIRVDDQKPIRRAANARRRKRATQTTQNLHSCDSIEREDLHSRRRVAIYCRLLAHNVLPFEVGKYNAKQCETAFHTCVLIWHLKRNHLTCMSEAPSAIEIRPTDFTSQEE